MTLIRFRNQHAVSEALGNRPCSIWPNGVVDAYGEPGNLQDLMRSVHLYIGANFQGWVTKEALIFATKRNYGYPLVMDGKPVIPVI